MTAGKRSQSAELNQKQERAKSALHKADQAVLEGHIKHCVREGIEHGDPDKTIENFTKAVEHFATGRPSRKKISSHDGKARLLKSGIAAAVNTK